MTISGSFVANTTRFRYESKSKNKDLGSVGVVETQTDFPETSNCSSVRLDCQYDIN